MKYDQRRLSHPYLTPGIACGLSRRAVTASGFGWLLSTGSPSTRSTDEFNSGTLPFYVENADCLSNPQLQAPHGFAYQVNRARHDDDSVWRGHVPRALEGRGHFRDRLNLRARSRPSLLDLLRRSRPRILRPRGNDAQSQREENLCHL